MPRIPDEEIDRLKRSVDLAALVRSRGVELRNHGSKDLIGKCPFHDDRDPSFVVSPDKGLFHCLGCGAAGNAIQFVERFDGLSFRHAFELLADGRGFTAPATSPQKECTVQRLETPFDPASDDATLMRQVVDFYHERLLKTPAALDYLRGRGLLKTEAVETFKIGFADRTLGLRLPDSNRKAGDEMRSRLQKLGILRESGHEHFNGSVVLPIFSGDRVTEMYGRKIRNDLRPGTPLHLYLPGPHEGIWNIEALDPSTSSGQAAGELILCEAPLDALTFWVNGFKNVTFIYGTQGFTDELFDALLAHRVKRIRIAYDADDAGNKAAERDVDRLTAHGIECYRLKFPWGMDANEYARKVTPPEKSLQVILNAAEWRSGKASADLPRRSARAEAGAPSSLAANLAAKERAAVAASAEGGPASGGKKEAAASPSVNSVSSVVETSALERVGEYHVLKLGPREYRVGGLDKNTSLEVLKVSVRLKVPDDPSTELGAFRFHLDAFDMARDGERRRFIERAAEETRLEKELIKRDLGKLLLALESELHERFRAGLDPRPSRPDIPPDERAEALAFLKSPDLVAKIGEAFDACGLVGEEANRLAAYLACTSRKLDKPLAVIIQSTSAAGKSTLMEAVLAMFPEEERVKYSAMTGQSLYYLGETDLQHKILAIVEEEGAEKASYALKLLQSEGELTIASTGKDPTTGRMETQEYHVEGPVMIFLTTTAIDIDEELQNRCLTLTVDESREQTEKIHALQRKARTLEGLRLKKQKARMLALLRNAQRLLAPIDVVNPFADALTFTADRTRTRRDHEKYLTLIDAIALLHQHQRGQENDEDGRPFVRVTLDDIALANKLAPELLGRSLDELPPQTRRVLETVKAIVRERCDAEKIEQRFSFFSRREVRARLGWGITQVRAHLERLREMEVIAARYGRAGSAFQYELLADCRETAGPDHIGLLDTEKLRVRQEPVGENGNLSVGCRAGGRQVQGVETPSINPNLSACRVRTSGPALAVLS